MMRIEINAQPVTHTLSKDKVPDLLTQLHNLLDRTKFFGTIELKYENGRLVYVKTQQNFTVDNLARYLATD